MKLRKILLLLLLLLATGQGAVSQVQYYLVNHDTLRVDNCIGDAFSIVYPDLMLNESLDAYIVVETQGIPFTLTLSTMQNVQENGVVLHMWDGDSVTGTSIDNIGQMVMGMTIDVSSGRLTAHLYRADSTGIYFSFNLVWPASQSFESPCINKIQNLSVSNLMHTSATLVWEGPANSYHVSYGDVTQTVNGHDIDLQNLEPDSEYTVTVIPVSDLSRPCCARTITFRTNCVPIIGCPDVTDLMSSSVRGYYGGKASQVGIVDYGSESYLSCHTVHTDTTETDPRTGGLLRTVCPGTRSSVRLGNWGSGAQSESLEYFLYIDTNYYALLLLRYAVVLQNPGHDYQEQPHFRLEILDSDGNIIDPLCGMADFSASASLGWNGNATEQNVWKDWTTVGFDMTPYQGRMVRLRLTTRDCTLGAHYGYAYFSVECSLNNASTEYCGETETNSITAPNGFNYIWYYDINNPVSTEQTVYFTNSDSLLHCRLVSKENPSCYVTLNTYAGHRWPLAVIDTLKTESLGCDGYRVYFLNRSVIANDGGDTVGWHCESAFWNFGDAYISYEYAPQHIYHDSGDYTVTLVSGIANNSCTDTTHFTIHIPDFYIPAVKDTFACDTFWIDGMPYTYDTVGLSYRVHHPEDCDTLYALALHVLTSPRYEFPPDTFCYSETYTWRGKTAGDPSITDTTRYRLVDRIPAENRCDSMLVLPLLQLPPARLSVDSKADCSNKKYYLTATSNLPYLYWTSDPHDTCLDGHETDSSLLVVPSALTTYTVTTYYRDTGWCPTSLAVNLAPAEFPQAVIQVYPEILTYEHPEFDAHDASRLYNSRWWGIETFPEGGDTVRLYETSPRLHYLLDDFNVDSVRVILAVSNEACQDTTHLTLPFVKVTIWAANAFTPSESVNSRFAPVATGLLETELTIYDRAGRQLFVTRDLQQGWDGTHAGTPSPQGAYAWFLRYRAADYPDIWQTATGTVTLLR